PASEQAGGRCERELRGRFGSRILPQVVPFDGSVGKALLFGQIACHAQREAPVAQAYHGLVENLQLAGGARETIERTSAASALLLASASLKTSASARRPAARRKEEVPAVAAAVPTAPREANPADTPPPRLPEPVRRRLTPAKPVPVAAVPAPAP